LLCFQVEGRSASNDPSPWRLHLDRTTELRVLETAFAPREESPESREVPRVHCAQHTVPTAGARVVSFPRLNDTPATYDGAVNVPAASHPLLWAPGWDCSRSGLETQMAPRPLAPTSHLANKDAG